MKIAARRDLDPHLKFMTIIIVSMATKVWHQEKMCNLNRRKGQEGLKREMRTLIKQSKLACTEERLALMELQNILQNKLNSIRRAEWHRRRWKERK